MAKPKKTGNFVVLEWSDNILEYDPSVLYLFETRDEAWNFAVQEAESESAQCDNEFPLKKDKTKGRITMDVLGERIVWQVKELIKKEQTNGSKRS